jgi:hypothetical protein
MKRVIFVFTVFLLISSFLPIPQAQALQATGGTITYSGGNTIHTFTSSGTFTVTSAGDVEYLVVGGGGGSSHVPYSGGGAGGGFRNGTGFAVTPQAYTITVGAGGTGATAPTLPTNGGDSTFATITSAGGGYGMYGTAGNSGGSGGGGGHGGSGGAGNTPSTSPVQGFAGGTGAGGTSSSAGGGGGSSAVGSNGVVNSNGANGGKGSANPIEGSTSGVLSGGIYWFSGGGGGGIESSAYNPGTGGLGGGGTGDDGASGGGTGGTANSGGGAGGGSGPTQTGGSGIVIISYVTPAPAPATPTNLVATSSSESIIGLDWDDSVIPAIDNITGYRIFSESPTGNGWTLEVNDTGTSTSSYSDTGLTTKTQYNYMVAGINATGIGDNSTASSDYTWGVPDPITGFTIINPTTSTLDPNYTAATPFGYVVTGYETLRDNVFLIYQGNVTTFTDASLSIATSYDYSIRALSSFGNSTWVNATGVTATGPPTGLTVNDCYHTCSTQLNLEWVAPVPGTGINGYRIFSESPIGNGFTTLTSNTTTTTLFYNNTGLTPGVFYNYKVAALNGGVSENSTSYAQTPHKLPYSVTDLVITPNDLLQFIGSWTAPSLFGTLNGYQINYTTPAGDPQTIYTSTNPGVTATISGLNPTVEYSFRVSANTYHGMNTTFGNIENATASSEIAVGDLTFDAGTNPDVNPIWYENYVVDSTTNNVQVRYDSALTVDCTVTERIADNTNTYTGLSETAAVGYVYHNFTVTNAGNDILDWDCYDQTDSTINGQYALTQSEAASGVGGFGNVPMFSLMGNFTGGLYGTEGSFAGIDLITLFIVIVSMLGFNRKNPALGVGVMATLLGAAWYYGLIPWTSGVLGGIAVVLVLAIGQGLKRD